MEVQTLWWVCNNTCPQSAGPEWGLRVCVFNKLLGGVRPLFEWQFPRHLSVAERLCSWAQSLLPITMLLPFLDCDLVPPVRFPFQPQYIFFLLHHQKINFLSFPFFATTKLLAFSSLTSFSEHSPLWRKDINGYCLPLLDILDILFAFGGWVGERMWKDKWLEVKENCLLHGFENHVFNKYSSLVVMSLKRKAL